MADRNLLFLLRRDQIWTIRVEQSSSAFKQSSGQSKAHLHLRPLYHTFVISHPISISDGLDTRCQIFLGTQHWASTDSNDSWALKTRLFRTGHVAHYRRLRNAQWRSYAYARYDRHLPTFLYSGRGLISASGPSLMSARLRGTHCRPISAKQPTLLVLESC